MSLRGPMERIDCTNDPSPPSGTYLTLSFGLSEGERELVVCDPIPLGRVYEGGCGEAPRGRGWIQLTLDGYELDDKATYACAEGYHLVSPGHTAVCDSHRDWTGPELVCSDEINWVKGGGAYQDGNVSTCGGPINALPFSKAIPLTQLVEVRAVTISFEAPPGELPTFIVSYLDQAGQPQKFCSHNEKKDNHTFFIQCNKYPLTHQVTVTIETVATTSLCEVKVFGEPFVEALECIRTPSGEDYKGHLNKTGPEDCLMWDQVSTSGTLMFPDGSATAAKNYCRKPQGGPSINFPSCYIQTSSGQELTMCTLLRCHKICRRMEDGSDYAGKLSDTGARPSQASDSCIVWNKSQMRRITDFPSGNPGATGPFCRNPGRSQERAWCYTSASPLNYAYCHVPQCPVSSRVHHLDFDLDNETDVEQLNTSVAEVRECMDENGGQRYTAPIFDSIMNMICPQFRGQHKQLTCHVANDRSQDSSFGDEAKWIRLFYRCAPDEITTAEPEVTTAPINVTTAPINVTTAPINVTTAPINVTTAPINVTTAPINPTTANPFVTTSSNSNNSGTSPTLALCPTSCTYTCRNSSFTDSPAELQARLEELQNELLVNTDTLSKTVRKKSSAYDSRPSSTASGTVAIVLLATVVGFLVSSDVISLVYHILNVWMGHSRRPKEIVQET
ncbi:uncharacterized protein LOC106012192 [Aplysia californica]|uniref:Uncharacterized protein LOC106012192 n=1 Tax=Aplysia californica TaxID=6500 RepID=A0ABM1VVL6_APLCA|nr:uncharacterized protein LOC106012192 [Aplysia californica]